MRVLIAFDKFKDALSARDTCQIAAHALTKCQPDWEIETAPLADGGDGFCDTLTGYIGGEFHETVVTGPLLEKAAARFGVVNNNRLQSAARNLLSWNSDIDKIAIIELAECSGISLTPIRDRSPWAATTAGLGEMIRATIANGAQGAIVGLGGSATHDLALGALWKMGYTFFDKTGNELRKAPTPDTWAEINRITSPSSSLPADFEMRVACDVENPLLGESGAAAVFGPQKGLTPNRYEELESATQRMAQMLCDLCHEDYSSMSRPGAGAAGGAAFGLQVGLGARIVPGYELVKNWIGLDAKFNRADIILTGEGRFDASSLQGKGPGALALEAVANRKQIYVMAGSLGELARSPLSTQSLIAISPPDVPLEEALMATRANLQNAITATFSNPAY